MKKISAFAVLMVSLSASAHASLSSYEVGCNIPGGAIVVVPAEDGQYRAAVTVMENGMNQTMRVSQVHMRASEAEKTLTFYTADGSFNLALDMTTLESAQRGGPSHKIVNGSVRMESSVRPLDQRLKACDFSVVFN